MKAARPSALLGIIALAAIVVAMVALGRSPVALGSAASQLLIFLVMFVVIIPAHELGHALVGALVGYRIRAVVVGVGPPLLQVEVAGVTVRLNLLPFGGITTGLAARASWPRLRMWLFAAGGPAANLLLCLLLKRHTGHGALLSPGEHSVAAIAATASWSVLFLNLLPFRTGEGQVSDGYSLFTVPFWSRERVLRARVLGGGAPVLLALQRGDLAAAERALAELRSRHGDHPVVLGHTGMVLHRTGRHDEARSAWRASLASDTDPFGRLLMKNNIAWVDFLLDDRASAGEAEAYSAEASNTRPDMAAFMGTRGAVLDWIGRSAEALPLLERAVANQTDKRGQASNHACLAMALAHVGRRPEAAAHRASARQLDPACELLERAEAAGDAGALDPSRDVAPAPSIWDRWGGLPRWRQVARVLAAITLLVPDRPFDLGLLAPLLAVLLDPEPAGLAALGGMQLWFGMLWALDRTNAAPISVAAIVWFLASGLVMVALALVRHRIGPRVPSRTAKMLGWLLGIVCAAQILFALLLKFRQPFGSGGIQQWLEPFRVSPGPAALFVGLAAVLLASVRRGARGAALLPAAIALLSVPSALDSARVHAQVAAIPEDGPPIVWADPRPAQVLRVRQVPGAVGSATLSPSGRSFLIDDEQDDRPDQPHLFRVGGFVGELRELRAFAALLVDDERVAVLRLARNISGGAELALVPLGDPERPFWVRPLPMIMGPGATLARDPDRQAILVVAGSSVRPGTVAFRSPLVASGGSEAVPLSTVGVEAAETAWYLTPAGQVGEVAVIAPETSRDGEAANRRTQRGHGRELWVASPSGKVRLLTDLPDLVIPPFLGRPNVWCVTSGENGAALLRVDPTGSGVERVAAGDVNVTWPISLGPSKLAFQSYGQIAVLDLAARRGAWLILPEGSRLAGDGLASLTYERSSNATNVMVFAEP